jgi:hypothetical protein
MMRNAWKGMFFIVSKFQIWLEISAELQNIGVLCLQQFSKTKPLQKMLKIISDVLILAVGRRREHYCTEFTVVVTITVKL